MQLYQLPVITTARPFDGTIIGTATLDLATNVYYMDDTARVNNSACDLTFAEYQTQVCPYVKVLTWSQHEIMTKNFEKTLITDAAQITADEFDFRFEILPPAQLHTIGEYLVFHISERITGNIVRWYAKCKNNYFTFDDFANVNDIYISNKLANFYP